MSFCIKFNTFGHQRDLTWKTKIIKNLLFFSLQGISTIVERQMTTFTSSIQWRWLPFSRHNCCLVGILIYCKIWRKITWWITSACLRKRKKIFPRYINITQVNTTNVGNNFSEISACVMTRPIQILTLHLFIIYHLAMCYECPWTQLLCYPV